MNLRDMRPNVGCDRVSREMIDKAAKDGDVDLLALYARNLMWALEEAWPMLEAVNDAYVELEFALRKFRR